MNPRRHLTLVLPLLAVVSGGAVYYTQAPSIDGAVTWLGRPAAAAVVELVSVVGATPPRAAGDTVMIDQRHLRFAPNVLGVPVGTVVEFKNSDPIMHNVFSPARQGADFDLGTYPQEESRTHLFDQSGTFVILCHVHPEMAAWVVVSESPFVAVTDDEGAFSMEGIPPGEYEATIWYRRRSADGGLVTVPSDTGSAIRIDVGR